MRRFFLFVFVHQSIYTVWNRSNTNNSVEFLNWTQIVLHFMVKIEFIMLLSWIPLTETQKIFKSKMAFNRIWAQFFGSCESLFFFHSNSQLKISLAIALKMSTRGHIWTYFIQNYRQKVKMFLLHVHWNEESRSVPINPLKIIRLFTLHWLRLPWNWAWNFLRSKFSKLFTHFRVFFTRATIQSAMGPHFYVANNALLWHLTHDWNIQNVLSASQLLNGALNKQRSMWEHSLILRCLNIKKGSKIVIVFVWLLFIMND